MNQPTNAIESSAVDPSLIADTLAPHEVERVVMQRLQSHPSLKFTRLDVHQCNQDSICLEGFLETNDGDVDLCEIVRGIHGIKVVVNRVLSAQPAVPQKG